MGAGQLVCPDHDAAGRESNHSGLRRFARCGVQLALKRNSMSGSFREAKKRQPVQAACAKETVMGMISVWRLAADEQIDELLSEPAMIEQILDEEGPDIDLDRAWHGLHYLLAGSARETAGPRGYILGGHNIGEVCVGYGPARALTSGEVAIFDDLLQCISSEELQKRFDAEALMRAEIYPEIWDRALTGEEDVLGYLVEHFVQLKQFVAGAHRDGVGVITYLA
jgi:Domain of unknown function (DUF1877)